jgi:hypothetical protein
LPVGIASSIFAWLRQHLFWRTTGAPSQSCSKSGDTPGLYYSDIISAFQDPAVALAPLLDFRGSDLEYRFPRSQNGLHGFSFTEQSGRMVGIMGASGSGKSTLLGVLQSVPLLRSECRRCGLLTAPRPPLRSAGTRKPLLLYKIRPTNSRVLVSHYHGS